MSDADLERSNALVKALRDAVSQTVVGQNDAVEHILITLFAQGHALLEGVPGVAKTLLARSLASAVGVEFGRVQFTPDLMPTDLIGTRVFDPESRRWEVHKGPIFCEVLLADEINRTPPKTQAALLEAMEERQVTLDGERHPLSGAFFVIATQNPLEFEGTYPLPEAQTDRFLTKIVIGYPEKDDELRLLGLGPRHKADLPKAVMTRDDLHFIQRTVENIRTDDSIRAYILSLLHATRASSSLRLGASPRSGLMLVRAAQARALFKGRTFVLPDDVKAMCVPVMRHRLALSTDAELDGQDVPAVLRGLLDSLPVLGSSEKAA